MSRLPQIMIALILLLITARVRAEPGTSCYEIPELIRIPKTFSDSTAEAFSPDGKFVLFSKDGEKTLLKFDDLQKESLGDIQNPTFSSTGNRLTYESTGSDPGLWIRDLKTGEKQKLPEQDICGHRLSEDSSHLEALTCDGQFKIYDLQSHPPRLISTQQSGYSFRPHSSHFNLENRASFVIHSPQNPNSSPTLHLVDFEKQKIYPTKMAFSTSDEASRFLRKLNSQNTPPELQIEMAGNFSSYGGTTVAQDGRTVLMWDSQGSATSVQLDQEKVKTFSRNKAQGISYALSPAGKFVLIQNPGTQPKSHYGSIESTSQDSSSQIHFSHFTFANDDSSIAYITPDRKQIRILNLSNGKEIRIPYIPQAELRVSTRETESIFFNGDSSQLLVYQEKDDGSTLLFYNKETGKLNRRLELDHMSFYRKNRKFIDHGSKLMVGNAPESPTGQTDVIDLKTGEVERLGSSTPHFASNALVIWPYSGYKDTLLKHRLICPSPLKLSENSSKPNLNSNCPLQLTDPKALLESQQLGAIEANLKLTTSGIDLQEVENECKKVRNNHPLNDSLIKRIDTRISDLSKNSSQSLSKNELSSLLLAIQDRAFSLNPERTLSLINAGIESGLLKQNPKLFQNVLIRLFDENKWLYFKLIEKLGTKFSDFDSLEISCFSPTKIDEMKKHLIAYLTNSSTNVIPFDRIERLRPIAPLFQSFNPEEIDHTFEELGLATAKAVQPKYPGLMTSTLYYFVSPAIKEKLLGKPAPTYTEFSLLKANKKLIPVALSTSEIDSNEQFKTPHGFHIKALPVPELPQNEQQKTNKTYQWKTGGNDLTAELSLKQVPASQLFPPRTGPDYDALWKDQTLTGLVLLGSNLGRDAPLVGEEYVRYFKDQGFSFNFLPDKITNVKDFIQERVSSGEIDYLIKEAHSGGVRLDLVNVINHSDLRIGTRIRSDGKTEKIYILFPSPQGPSRTITTSEFGSWIQERDRTGKEDLVYFNTSCFAGDRAASDVAAASSSKLMIIPVHPKMTASFFINRPESAIYQLLESIRNNKDFQGFRENLNHVSDYQKRTQNVYLMPDEPEYQDKIVNTLNEFPIHAQIEIRDQTGQEVHFDPLSVITKKRPEPR